MSFLHRARKWGSRYSRYVLAACYVTVVAIDMPIEYQGFVHENPVFSLLMILAAPAWILFAIATIPLGFALNSDSARTMLLFANLGIGCAVNLAFLLGVRLRKNEHGNRRLVLTK
jgi:hypothetical protein